jgi:hypothetical protein
MHSDRNHGSYKDVILCFILVVQVVDMSGLRIRFLQNWIAEPRFCEYTCDRFTAGIAATSSYCSGVKGLEPDRGLDRKMSFW